MYHWKLYDELMMCFLKSDDKDEYINTTKAWIISGFKVWWMMRSLVLVGFFRGSILGLLPVLTGNDRKWAPNVVPAEGNWVDDKDEYINTTKAWIKSGFKVWWMIRSLVLVDFSWGQVWGYFRFWPEMVPKRSSGREQLGWRGNSLDAIECTLIFGEKAWLLFKSIPADKKK